jgi:hypothetical protein
MEHTPFDRLTRTLCGVLTRRGLVSAIMLPALGLPGFTEAKKRKKRKKKRKKPCSPESPATTCAGRCGTIQNNCQQAIECLPCPDGQFCLSNGICATYCGPSGGTCPGQCGCPSWPTTEGAILCGDPLPGARADIPQVCESTADCPLGSICQLAPCGPGGTLEGRCRQLCNA